MHRVVALVHPPQSTFELACAAEVFGKKRRELPTRYAFSVCTAVPGPVSTGAGYDMLVDAGLDALARADTVVLPGRSDPRRPPSPATVEALRAAHARGARILAICSGAFPLAYTGLLDGRRATSHWAHAGELASLFPAIGVDPDVLYIDHGDVATSAGAAAGIDLCLHVVREDHGAAYAATVARNMVMPPHREGGQLQYATPPPPARLDGSLAPVLEWALGRLAEPVGVTDLAARAGVSPRTLARRFAEQLGVTPGRWLLTRRVDAARVLLESSDAPLDTVAHESGLSSATNMRRRFLDVVGTTPGAYRRAFRTTAHHGTP
ncbi:helix-turn-helix domain-containing protein [Streptomyces sp. SID3343]|uniref:helix-turn-helix domain-containing protein n=1 Tax=Streptomyces sp. SID3343 TaxID=2690260 RepID=UPI00136A7A50|nr:helix-turn-helix domain-containing protein [Streptomyces sp. SID3343]MYW01618.1 helix-turn-helix domain-containing protein [Streptomyces sp. SID3343]